jgi:site-specific DNA-cytosine methylase
MFRVIRETLPRWVIAENVRGLVTWNEGMVLEQVCADLESAGYEVQPFIIPAVAVNAPHRRDRIWIIANCRWEHGEQGNFKGMETNAPKRTACATHAERQDKDASNPKCTGHEREINQARQSARHNRGTQSPDWTTNWPEVATRLCGVFNGVSPELDEDRQRMSDGIYSKYAQTFNKITRQDLPCLWQAIQSQEVQWSVGRLDPIQDATYLFTVLWQFAFQAKGQDYPPFESPEVQEAYLRNVWHEKGAGCPPQGWRYNKQYAQEHKDALSSLSHELALATEEVKKRYLKDRNPRLKSLGNAIVPQVAEMIMKAIKDLNLQNK